MQVSPDAAAMEAALDAVRQKQLLLTADLTSSRKRWERRRALPGLLENLNGQIRTKAAEEQSLATSLSQQQAAAVAAPGIVGDPAFRTSRRVRRQYRHFGC